MDQFASGQIHTCPYVPTVGLISRWVGGLGLFFLSLYFLTISVLRNLDLFLGGGFYFVFLILLLTFFSNLVQENISTYYYFSNLIAILLSIFILIILFNLLSLIPYTFAYTSHIILTLTLASLLINFVNVIRVERRGLSFIKIFLPNGAPRYLAFFLILIEFISYNTRVLSLAIRLFANIMSGHILLTIFAGFSVIMGFFQGLIVEIIMCAIYVLELVIAFLQGYVFMTLSTIYFHESIYAH